MQQCIDMNMERVEYPQEVEEEKGASTEEEEKEKTGKIQIGIDSEKPTRKANIEYLTFCFE